MLYELTEQLFKAKALYNIINLWYTLALALECYGVDTAGIRWFESYLFGRTQKCAVNGKFQMLFQLLVVFRKEAAWDRYHSLSTLTTCQIASTLARRECLLMTPV